MNKKNQKEYDKYLNEQLKIVRTSCERCVIRIIEKYHKLKGEEE